MFRKALFGILATTKPRVFGPFVISGEKTLLEQRASLWELTLEWANVLTISVMNKEFLFNTNFNFSPTFLFHFHPAKTKKQPLLLFSK